MITDDNFDKDILLLRNDYLKFINSNNNTPTHNYSHHYNEQLLSNNNNKIYQFYHNLNFLLNINGIWFNNTHNGLNYKFIILD